MNYFFYIIFFFTTFSTFSQKYLSFEGKLVYKVDLIDSIGLDPIETKFVTIFTNDTLVRTETESNRLGSQTVIRHLTLNKYYLLLEVNNQKYAIQHVIENDTIPSKYSFNYKRKSKKIQNLKSRKVVVEAKHFENPIEMYYIKNMNPKYIDALKGIKGLPVDYYIYSEDGIYHYTLIDITNEKTSTTLYGIPKEYKKVSFDEFMEEMIPKK